MTSDLAKYRSAAEWTTKNSILPDGVPGFEDDTGKLKIGDGHTSWNSLSYQDVAPFTLPKPIETPSGVSAADVSTEIAATHDTDAEREQYVPARLSDAALKTAFGLPTAGSYTYNSDGTVASAPDGSIYAYNSDGTVHSKTLNGVTRVYSYDGSGNVTSVA